MPDKTRRKIATFATFPTCKNPGVAAENRTWFTLVDWRSALYLNRTLRQTNSSVHASPWRTCDIWRLTQLNGRAAGPPEEPPGCRLFVGPTGSRINRANPEIDNTFKLPFGSSPSQMLLLPSASHSEARSLTRGRASEGQTVRLPPRRAEFHFWCGHSSGFCTWDSYWTMPVIGGFSRGSPVSPTFTFRCCYISTSRTRVKSPLNLPTLICPGTTQTNCQMSLQKVKREGEAGNETRRESNKPRDPSHPARAARLLLGIGSAEPGLLPSGARAASRAQPSTAGNCRSPGRAAATARCSMTKRASSEMKDVMGCSRIKWVNNIPCECSRYTTVRFIPISGKEPTRDTPRPSPLVPTLYLMKRDLHVGLLREPLGHAVGVTGTRADSGRTEHGLRKLCSASAVDRGRTLTAPNTLPSELIPSSDSEGGKPMISSNYGAQQDCKCTKVLTHRDPGDIPQHQKLDMGMVKGGGVRKNEAICRRTVLKP
ncbi:hypothetical protein PR048_023610 [Dryococelus australis]|uniref:Uncharacterized protein n=1 Tax=Dryococelus australis TaxID=614101 RepID=A0ABQ9GUK6_9NEOP|nr:hypothetical protein PR048_023610 [Dryococelus australis]